MNLCKVLLMKELNSMLGTMPPKINLLLNSPHLDKSEIPTKLSMMLLSKTENSLKMKSEIPPTILPGSKPDLLILMLWSKPYMMKDVPPPLSLLLDAENIWKP